MIQRHTLLRAGVLWLGLTANALAQDSLSAAVRVPDHPRILLLRGEERALARQITTDTTWRRLQTDLLAECDALLKTSPVERVMTGRRLLGTSREALRRLFFLSYAWRLTGEIQYRDRAERELLAIASFSDWNPSHFLDVGEMTLAAAIGLDWLYDALPETTRSQVRDAILKKGLEPSLDTRYNGWLRATSNWNQVCNAGISYGALAIYEHRPQLARQLLNRAIKTVTLPMGEYAPDGAYPEGYNYWGYGTTFNVLLISALEKTFGRDFGLTAAPGFLKTAAYLENMITPTGDAFNYADARLKGDLQPAMFWFAARTRQPSLLWEERQFLFDPNVASNQTKENNRLFPAVLLWGGRTPIKTVTPPTTTAWIGKGKNPVALFRTSWTDPAAIFVGLKGGSPRLSHAHMDVGSFVMEADGVRWAMDFGMQEYESLESKQVDLWNMRQDSQRWRIYRYNNFTHNTLTVNESLQRTAGEATITGASTNPRFMWATTDLTALYSDALTKANRGVAIVDRHYVVVQDEVEAGAADATVRWTMLTPATVRLLGENRAELTKDGKTLLVEAPAGVTLRTWSTVPPEPYDAPNPGTTLLGFEAKVPARTTKDLTVFLLPSRATSVKRAAVRPLNQWTP